MTDEEHAQSGLISRTLDSGVTLASIALLRSDGAALFQHRDEKAGLSCAGEWVFPGGHSEPGERIDLSAAREFGEETGYECKNLQFLGNYTVTVGSESFAAAVFWDIYDGQQKIGCFEGQAMEFIQRRDGERYNIAQGFLMLWDEAVALAGDCHKDPMIMTSADS